MANLKEIEALTKAYADRRGTLAGTVGGLQDELDQVRRKYIGRIKVQVGAVKDAEAALRAAIEASPALFVKPRSLTVHGIKVGFAKGKGKIVFEDADKVVALIEKHLPELADALIAVTKKPVKDALLNLTVDELKKIGCKVAGSDDQVVIKDTTDEIDKLVKAFLAEEEEAVA